MGLIGGGDDSSLASSSGWGGQPPPSSSDWGSSSNNNNSSSAGGSNWASAGSSCGGSGAAVSAAMAISGSNAQSGNGTLRSSQQQSSGTSSNQGNMLMSSQTSSDQQQSLLSSSPKPLSSSWAQAAGKGLAVHATSASSGNGPNPSASTASAMSSTCTGMSTNSHDTSNIGGPLGFGGATMSAQSCSSQQQQQSSGASSCLSTSSVATTANCSSGGMNAINVNSSMAYGSAASSSNGSNGNNNSGPSAGLNMMGGSNVASSSGNSMDAANNATANKRQMGSSSAPSGPISDLIGGLSDDFRETLLTEKWGASVINQDSPWNLPSSSHTSSSSPKVNQETSTWRCPVNSGTEIWESSIRQKKGSLGAPTGSLLSSASVGMPMGGAPVQPWGQAPTSNIGGTWGEEEGIDTSNHWTGVPHSSSLNSVTSMGGGNGGMAPTGAPPSLAHAALAGHVNSSSINANWSAGPSALSNGGPASGISNPYSLLNASGLAASALASNSIAGDNGPPGANNWNGNDKNAYESRKATNWGNFDQSDSVSESNWDKSGNDNGAFGTWNPPDNRKEGCWDKESNDSFKGVDDGTAVWGNPSSGAAAANARTAANNNGNNGQHGLAAQRPQPPNWKDQQQQKMYGMPMPPLNKNGYSGNPGWNNGNNGANKPLNQNNMLTRTWTDASSGHRKSPSMWNDDNKSINGTMTPNNWSDGQIDTSSWGSSKPTKPLTREMILSSKQFRLLVDLGHKKEDAEAALRNYSLRFEDALAHLENAKPIKSAFGVGGNSNPLMDFNKMTLNAAGNGGNGPLPRTHSGLAPMPLNTASSCQPNSLATLAQRIHLAVSTGFLNPQILNQPLSNQNLEILSELLNQIKLLKEVQLQMQQSNGNLKSSLEYRHREVRQNITQLQNQLRNDAGVKIGSNGLGKDMFENNEGPLNKDMFQLSKGPVDNYGGNGIPSAHTAGPQGSRLFNWKHSKQQSANEHAMGSDFSRAPGSLSKSNHSTANWSNFMDDNGGGWPDKAADQQHATGPLDCDYGGLSNFGAPMAAPDTFDSAYGKHSSWKPTAKSVLGEDDPRSPIAQKAIMNENSFAWNSTMGGPSANAISKGSTSLLGGGAGQCPMDSLNSPFGFSGNTWSYNSGPGSSAAANAAMGVNAAPFSAGEMNKNKNTMNKSNNSHTWSNSALNTGDYSDSLWTPPAGNNAANANGPAGGAGKPRPPPGLSKNSGNATSASSANSIWSSGANGSEYLRLRNLTPQIDGSTLKTLCCQHGPLNLFHLFLNNGAAIARYANREQAIKAQSALNNCVLGNTTILADLPQESEVQQYMQLINGGGHSGNPNASAAQSANSAPHNSSSGGSHNGHHGGSGHHSGYGGNPTTSWSNGTNASQSNAGSGTGMQSNAAPSTAPVSLYSRTSSVGASSGPNSAPISVAHMSPFANSSPVVNLPYNSGAPPLVTSHSNYNSVLNQAAVSNSQFSKIDNALLNSWNTASSGSAGLWDSSALPAAGGGLWSSGGYGVPDRNTPIQNAFLPGDLLTGDNN